MLQSVLDALDEGVVVFDQDHIVRAINQKILLVLEIDPSTDVVGMHIRDTIRLHGDLRDAPRDEFEKEVNARYRLVTGQYHDGQGFRIRRRSRKERMIEMRRKPSEDGGAVITTLDVTPEVDLERRTSQLETVIQNTDDGVFQIDGSGVIELFNDRMAELYRLAWAGISVGDHVSKFVDYLLANTVMTDAELQTFGKIDHETSGLEMPLIREQIIRTNWGSVLEATRVRLPGGGALATHRDVTAAHRREQLLEEARAAAEDASRLKSEFIARVTHELRTPMHGVLGLAALLERSGLNDAQLRFLETLQHSGKHMVDLIDGLLTVSTQEAGDVVLEVQTERLDLLISDCFEMLRPNAEEKGLSFELESSLDAQEALVDGTRLTQIIVNLLANAIKFTEVGQVRLSAESIELEDVIELCVRISDTGVGIPKSKFNQVFDKFTQLGNGSGGCSEGVGLGLSIALSLTELMNGRLDVESEEGEGSAFTLTLPLAKSIEAHSSSVGGEVADVSPPRRIRRQR